MDNCPSISGFGSRLLRSAVLLGGGGRRAHNSVCATPGCQNQWNYRRRFCNSFYNPTRALSSQRSFVKMKAFFTFLLLSALFGGHCAPTPCGILASGFPRVTLLVPRDTHPKPRLCRVWVCRTGECVWSRLGLPEAICCFNKFESNPSFPFVPNR